MASNSVSNKRKHNGRKSSETETSTSSNQDESRRDYGTLSDVAEKGESYMARGAEQFRELTRDHEVGAVVMAAVAGFGVGVLIGAALMPSRKPPSWRDRIMAEGLGQRIMDHIENVLPQAIVEHMRR